MGRVARYRKIKAIDPFNPRTHGVVDLDAGKAYDLPPSSVAAAASRVPKKLREMMKLRAQGLPPRADKPRPERALAHVQALPGESLKAFRRRLWAEARKVKELQKKAASVALAGGVSEKRKEYLERRKRKRDGEGEGEEGGEGESGSEDDDGADGGAGGGAGERRGALVAGSPTAPSSEAIAASEAQVATFGKLVADFDPALLPEGMRKKVKRAHGATAGAGAAAEEEAEARMAFRGRETVRFGERVEAPPRLTVLPRMPKAQRQQQAVAAAAAAASAGAGGGVGAGGGGVPAQKAKKTKPAAAAGGAGAGRSAAAAAPGKPGSAASGDADADRRASEVHAAQMEAARDTARAAYAAMKAKRREAFAAERAAAVTAGGGGKGGGALRAPSVV